MRSARSCYGGNYARLARGGHPGSPSRAEHVVTAPPDLAETHARAGRSPAFHLAESRVGP